MSATRQELNDKIDAIAAQASALQSAATGLGADVDSFLVSADDFGSEYSKLVDVGASLTAAASTLAAIDAKVKPSA